MFKVWNDIVDKCVQTVTTDGKTNEVATLSCLPAIFINVVNALLMFAGLAALIMFIIGSLRLMWSKGDPKKVQAAKNNFTYGVIGLVIILFSFTIISLIAKVTGVECIKTFGFGCK